MKTGGQFDAEKGGQFERNIQFNVKMSGLQGRTARNHQNNYALCILRREQHDTEVTKEYFTNNAKFITIIGSLIQNKVDGMENGIKLLNQYKEGEIVTSLNDEQYSVYVNKEAWSQAIGFNEFIAQLNSHFQIAP